MSKLFTTEFSKQEMTWLYRHLMSGKEKAEGQLKGPTTMTHDQVNELVKFKDEMEKFAQMLSDRLAEADRNKLKIMQIREELEEAIILVAGDDNAHHAAFAELVKLPTSDLPFKISFDRHTLKFVLKLIEDDLQKFRGKVIPNYEKRAEEDFTDPIRTKTYWVNKARKSKDTLDALKTKLEKGL